MELVKETTISVMTTDGKKVEIGDTVAFNTEDRCCAGVSDIFPYSILGISVFVYDFCISKCPAGDGIWNGTDAGRRF